MEKQSTLVTEFRRDLGFAYTSTCQTTVNTHAKGQEGWGRGEAEWEGFAKRKQKFFEGTATKKCKRS